MLRTVLRARLRRAALPNGALSRALSSSGYPVLDGFVDVGSSSFQESLRHMDGLLSELRGTTATAMAGGGERATALHHSRGKMLPRKRIEALLDPGSPFLELSPLAGHELYGEEKVPSGGLVTGIGSIHGRLCMIVANDATVRGGTYYPITVKKHLRAQEVARENRLPCIYLVDSGGANLPRQAEVFPDRDHFGRIFFNQARMSAAAIPQLAVVLGSCTAGGAYVPAMADENIIVRGNGTIFLGGPPLVKAATGEEVSAEELGGADVHCKVSGVSDHLALDEPHALQLTRQVVASLPPPPPGSLHQVPPEPPLYDAAELGGLVPTDPRQPMPMRPLLARLLDGSRLLEFKPDYGDSLVCGFAHIEGFAVGVVANDGVLFSDSAVKGAHFVQLCCQRQARAGRALLASTSSATASTSLATASTSAATASPPPPRPPPPPSRRPSPPPGAAALRAEHHRLHGGKAGRARGHRQARRQARQRRRHRQRAQAHRGGGRLFRRGKLRHVRPVRPPRGSNPWGRAPERQHHSRLTRPRRAPRCCCARSAYSPRLMWMWPNARIGVMGGAQAAGVLVGVKQAQLAKRGTPMAEAEAEAMASQIQASFDAEAHPYYATARLWDDGIIEPAQTRAVVAMGLGVAANAPVPPTDFGVFRM